MENYPALSGLDLRIGFLPRAALRSTLGYQIPPLQGLNTKRQDGHNVPLTYDRNGIASRDFLFSR
jgi:hypothetical protein